MASEEPRVNIGNISGNSTVAFGSQAHAESHHVHQGEGSPPPLDEAMEQLLSAVRELRADLDQRVRASDQTAALDEALAQTEEEITTTGQAGPTRRERLRELLSDSQALVTFLASAGALAGLLGM